MSKKLTGIKGGAEWLGGVCSGAAYKFGIPVAPVRLFAFLFSQAHWLLFYICGCGRQ